MGNHVFYVNEGILIQDKFDRLTDEFIYGYEELGG